MNSRASCAFEKNQVMLHTKSTLNKLSHLGEHSEVTQARSLHACWARMLYHDRLETIENRQSTNSAKTLKIFNVYSSLGLRKIMSQFFNDLEIQNPGS